MHTTTIIKLDASLESDLKWTYAAELASNAEKILWEFDFNFKSISDPMAYLSYQIALDHFKDTLLKDFTEKTIGAILYRGSMDEFFEENAFQEWTQDHPSNWEKEFLLKLFSRDLFVDFLELLMIALPIEVEPYLDLDLSLLQDLAEKMQFAHPERFEKFKLLGAPNESRTGILLPPVDLYDKTLYKKFEGIAKQLKTPYRLISERSLNMQWEELDHLYVCESGLSTLGKRMLQGFIAGGGIVYGEKREDIS